ncbi:ERF family protein [Lacrimispora indolis]|uniref:ERF family protein n=1 Tax=Lacrimispora indolis TaxID=69825 RepID=UPI00045EB9CA|nr:ERF family protein [Lacrimispora indolis]
MNIQEKLLQVQAGLKAPKSQYNIFGKYYYRNCEDIQEAAKPLLGEVKAVLIVGDELVQMGERFYIKATARFVDCESGDEIKNTAFAREELDKKGMDASQITGSTSSYARKYALNGLFCIDDVKDADHQGGTDEGKAENNKTSGKGRSSSSNTGGSGKNAGQGKGPANPPAAESIPNGAKTSDKVTDPMITSVKSLIEKYSDKGLKMDKILAMYKIKKIEEMTLENYKDCMNKLKLYEKEDIKHE